MRRGLMCLLDIGRLRAALAAPVSCQLAGRHLRRRYCCLLRVLFTLRRAPAVLPGHRSAAALAVAVLACLVPCWLRAPLPVTPLPLPAPSALRPTRRSLFVSQTLAARRAHRDCARCFRPLSAPCAVACDTTAAACSECPSPCAVTLLCLPDICRPPRSPLSRSLRSPPVSSWVVYL